MEEIIKKVKNLSVGFKSQKGQEFSILKNITTNIKRAMACKRTLYLMILFDHLELYSPPMPIVITPQDNTETSANKLIINTIQPI